MVQKEGEGSSCGERSWTMFMTLIFPSGTHSPGDGSCERVCPSAVAHRASRATSCQSPAWDHQAHQPAGALPWACCLLAPLSLHLHLIISALPAMRLWVLLPIPSPLPALPSCGAISQPATILPSGVFQQPSSEPSASLWKWKCGPSSGKGLPFL